MNQKISFSERYWTRSTFNKEEDKIVSRTWDFEPIDESQSKSLNYNMSTRLNDRSLVIFEEDLIVYEMHALLT